MSGRLARIARLALATAGAVLLVLGLVTWGLARSGALDAWLSATLAARLGAQVRFAAARIIWWPHPGVELDQVALVVAAPREDSAASAATIRCRLDLGALLDGHVALEALRVDDLRVTVERSADGSVHAGGLEGFAAAIAPSDAGGAAPPLPVLRLRNADIALRGDQSTTAPVIRLHPLSGRLTPSGAGTQVAVAGRIDGGGSIRARGEVTSLSAPSFNAALNIDALDAAAVVAWFPRYLTGVAAQGRLRVAATLTARGTTALDGHASLELTGGELARSDWRVASPLRLTADATWNGTALRLSQGHVDAAHVTGPAVSADTIAASFAYGDGALRIDGAELRACAGTWRGSGQATLDTPPHLEGALDATGVDGVQLVSALNALGLSTPLPQFAASLHLSAAASGVPGQTWSGHAAFDTSGATQWPTLRVDGPLQVASDVQVDGTALTLSNGHARASRVAVDRLAADAVEADFTYAQGAFRIAALRGRALGGAWTYSGTVPGATSGAWSGQLTGARVSAAALSGMPTVDGLVDLSAQLAGRDTQRVTATATVRLASDALSWNDLRIAPPAEVSAAARLDGTRLSLSNGRARLGAAHFDALTASDISAAFTYADATLQVATLQARAAGGTWKARGAIGFAGEPRWNGTIDAQHIDPDPLLRALADASGGARTEGAVADLSLSLTHAGDGTPHGSATVQLAAGTLLWDELRVHAPAHAHGAFAIPGGAFTLIAAKADAARAAYGPLAGTTASAALGYRHDRLSFTDLRFQSCGGAWIYSGAFTLRAGGPFNGRLSIEGAAPPALATMIGDPDFDVPFARFDLDSEFTGRADPDWLSTVRGSGSGFLTNGTVRGATVLGPIWKGLVGPGAVMDALNRSTTHVAQISTTFELREGRLDTTDFSLISDDYSVTGVGSIGLDGTLDLTTRVQLTAHGVQKMLVVGSIPLPTAAFPSLPPIPAFVTGSVSDPIVRPDLSALPASTARWLVDAALHVPRGVGSAVLHRLQQLWHHVTGATDQDANPP